MRLEYGDHMILHCFGSAERDLTVQRLAFVAAYGTDPDFKHQVCSLRERIADEMTDTMWASFFPKLKRNMATVIRCGRKEWEDNFAMMRAAAGRPNYGKKYVSKSES